MPLICTSELFFTSCHMIWLTRLLLPFMLQPLAGSTFFMPLPECAWSSWGSLPSHQMPLLPVGPRFARGHSPSPLPPSPPLPLELPTSSNIVRCQQSQGRGRRRSRRWRGGRVQVDNENATRKKQQLMRPKMPLSHSR